MIASILLISQREKRLCLRCAAEVKTMPSFRPKTFFKSSPTIISSLRRACQIRKGLVGGTERPRRHTSPTEIVGTPGAVQRRPTSAVFASFAICGATARIVVVTPE